METSRQTHSISLSTPPPPSPQATSYTDDSRAVLERRVVARLRKGKVVPRQPAATVTPRLVQAQKMDQP